MTRVVADACCNHNGERFLMQKYIEKAAEIGCINMCNMI